PGSSKYRGVHTPRSPKPRGPTADRGFDTSGNPHQGGASGARNEESGRGGAGRRAVDPSWRSKVEERARKAWRAGDKGLKPPSPNEHHATQALPDRAARRGRRRDSPVVGSRFAAR